MYHANRVDLPSIQCTRAVDVTENWHVNFGRVTFNTQIYGQKPNTFIYIYIYIYIFIFDKFTFGWDAKHINYERVATNKNGSL